MAFEDALVDEPIALLGLDAAQVVEGSIPDAPKDLPINLDPRIQEQTTFGIGFHLSLGTEQLHRCFDLINRPRTHRVGWKDILEYLRRTERHPFLHPLFQQTPIVLTG